MHHAKIIAKDKRGITEKILALPIIIGREAAKIGSLGDRSAFDVDGKFVSRHQLTIFELLGSIYYLLRFQFLRLLKVRKVKTPLV